jgi:ABC-type Fe3+-hydroxamate transport system substrate-binding protein
VLLTDALGRAVPLAAPPQRIVSLVPSLTEFLFAVGAGARVVGITDYCTEPAAQVADLPRVRGTKNPDRSRVGALRPDLVLASKEENRERDVRAFEERGIPVYVTDICSVAGALTQLGTLAEVLGLASGAAPLLGEMQAALEEQRTRQAAPWRVLVFIWRDPWMAVGADTYADDLLAVCGADNLARRFAGRYPRAALEAFLELDPDVIMLPDEPYRFGEADRAAFAPFTQCAAVRHGRVLLCDGALLTWYGPRTAAALRFFGQVGRSR